MHPILVLKTNEITRIIRDVEEDRASVAEARSVVATEESTIAAQVAEMQASSNPKP